MIIWTSLFRLNKEYTSYLFFSKYVYNFLYIFPISKIKRRLNNCFCGKRFWVRVPPYKMRMLDDKFLYIHIVIILSFWYFVDVFILQIQRDFSTSVEKTRGRRNGPPPSRGKGERSEGKIPSHFPTKVGIQRERFGMVPRLRGGKKKDRREGGKKDGGGKSWCGEKKKSPRRYGDRSRSGIFYLVFMGLSRKP